MQRHTKNICFRSKTTTQDAPYVSFSFVFIYLMMLVTLGGILGCSETTLGFEDDSDSASQAEGLIDSEQSDNVTVQPEANIYAYAGGYYSIREEGGRWFKRDGEGFAFIEGEVADATPFFLKASDLATYLLYDSEIGYVAVEDGSLIRKKQLHSDLFDVINGVASEAEWEIRASGGSLKGYRHRRH